MYQIFPGVSTSERFQIRLTRLRESEDTFLADSLPEIEILVG